MSSSSSAAPGPPPLVVGRADLTPKEVRNFAWVDLPTVDGRLLRVREPTRVERSLLQIRMAGYAAPRETAAADTRPETASAEQLVQSMLDIAVLLAIDEEGRPLGLTREQAGGLLCADDLHQTLETAAGLLAEGAVADALGLSEAAAAAAGPETGPDDPGSKKNAPAAKPRAKSKRRARPAPASATSSTS